ncbi:PKD domain-containing protein [bacterium]|nr:PKD domain-containing protein [bacterium]
MRFRITRWMPAAAVLMLLAGGNTALWAEDSPQELKQLDKLEGYDSLPKEGSVKKDLEAMPKQPVETIIVWSEASPTRGKAPLAVTFTADPPEGVADPTYTWTFSDGGTASGAKVSHTFDTAGIHKVMLKVTSPKGDLGMDELRVKVTN